MLSEVIPDFVEFKTDHYKQILDDLKYTMVYMVDGKFRVWNKEKEAFKELKYKTSIGDLGVTIGLGGLHDVAKKWIAEAGKDEFLAELDASAYYPNLMVLLEDVPDHFKDFAKAFVGTVKEIIEENKDFDPAFGPKR